MGTKMMTQLRISRLLKSSLNKRLLSNKIQISSPTASYLNSRQRLQSNINLYSSSNIIQSNSIRQFSTSNVLLKKDDKNDKKDDKDKNDKNKKSAEQEKIEKELFEAWNKLSNFGKSFIIFVGLGIGFNLLSLAMQTTATTSMEESDMTAFSKLLAENNVSNIQHDSKKNRLEFK